MFDNLSPEEATIAYIIQAKKSFSDTITQYDITDEFIVRRGIEISPRKVRRIIEGLIKEGYPIISTPHQPNAGYCWGGNAGEALDCYKRLRRKGIKILIRARRIMRNERNRKGQGELPFDNDKFNLQSRLLWK